MYHIIPICEMRFRYNCDDNRKRFAIIVPIAVFVPHWNVRYCICDFSRSITITANILHLLLSYLRFCIILYICYAHKSGNSPTGAFKQKMPTVRFLKVSFLALRSLQLVYVQLEQKQYFVQMHLVKI